MVCLPVVMLANLATGGALTAAVGSLLGSEILGGAVLGLIASGGKPEGALFGALGAALTPAAAAGSEAAGAAAGEGAASQLAKDTVGNAVSGSADEFAQLATEGADNLAGYSAGEMAQSAAQGLADSGLTSEAVEMATAGGAQTAAEQTAKGSLRDAISRGGDAATKTKGGNSILQKIEGFAKANPMTTKMGLGALQSVGETMGAEKTLKTRARLMEEAEVNANNRAFRGMDTSLGFKPSTSGYKTPLQKYLESTQQ